MLLIIYISLSLKTVVTEMSRCAEAPAMFVDDIAQDKRSPGLNTVEPVTKIDVPPVKSKSSFLICVIAPIVVAAEGVELVICAAVKPLT